MELKKNNLFIILSSFFICNVLLAEFIGVKIFSLESTFGFTPVNWKIFDETLSFNLTAGVLLWPVVFVITDLINEYFGRKGVRKLSMIASILIIYAFIMIYISIQTKPADFWLNSFQSQGIKNIQNSYSVIFGQGMNIIVGSLAAFIIGQLIDVWVFHFLKKKTGDKYLWFRATVSTMVSQLIDSFVVLFIAFYIGAGWKMNLVLGVCLMNYLYKFIMALILTPVLEITHTYIDKYLGLELATKMKLEAHKQ